MYGNVCRLATCPVLPYLLPNYSWDWLQHPRNLWQKNIMHGWMDNVCILPLICCIISQFKKDFDLSLRQKYQNKRAKCMENNKKSRILATKTHQHSSFLQKQKRFVQRSVSFINKLYDLCRDTDSWSFREQFSGLKSSRLISRGKADGKKSGQDQMREQGKEEESTSAGIGETRGAGYRHFLLSMSFLILQCWKGGLVKWKINRTHWVFMKAIVCRELSRSTMGLQTIGCSI